MLCLSRSILSLTSGLDSSSFFLLGCFLFSYCLVGWLFCIFWSKIPILSDRSSASLFCSLALALAFFLFFSSHCSKRNRTDACLVFEETNRIMLSSLAELTQYLAWILLYCSLFDLIDCLTQSSISSSLFFFLFLLLLFCAFLIFVVEVSIGIEPFIDWAAVIFCANKSLVFSMPAQGRSSFVYASISDSTSLLFSSSSRQATFLAERNSRSQHANTHVQWQIRHILVLSKPTTVTTIRIGHRWRSPRRSRPQENRSSSVEFHIRRSRRRQKRLRLRPRHSLLHLLNQQWSR